jgi:tryptophan synthase alpha chain
MIAYLTAGDPRPKRHARPGRRARTRRRDLIELGVPFSDPIADGPVIQRAGDRACGRHNWSKGSRHRRERSGKLRDSAAAVHLSESRAALRFSNESGARRQSRRDRWLPAHRRQRRRSRRLRQGDARRRTRHRVSRRAHQHAERLKLVAEYSSGFVYLVSRTGVTGERVNGKSSRLPVSV